MALETINLPVNAEDRIRYAYFYLTSGSAPALTCVGLQPQLSVNSGIFSNNGIGTLVSLGSGNYYAQLTNFTTRGNYVGDVLHTRFSYPNIPDTLGSTIQLTRPLWSSTKHASATGVKFINTNSGQRVRRNVYYMPGGVGADN